MTITSSQIPELVMTVSHLWHSNALYKSSNTCNQNSEGEVEEQEAVVTISRDERSENKHHVVDTEGAALCQNAVKRVLNM